MLCQHPRPESNVLPDCPHLGFPRQGYPQPHCRRQESLYVTHIRYEGQHCSTVRTCARDSGHCRHEANPYGLKETLLSETLQPAFPSCATQKSLKRVTAMPKRLYFSRIRSTLSHCDMSDRMTLSPTCNPERISIVVTELRPNFTLTREASEPSSEILKRLIVLSCWPCTGRPTYRTSLRFSSSMVPSTLRSARAPGGSGSSNTASTVTVPFWTEGSMRETCPMTTPLRVSIVAFCPIVMSLACVSAILISAFSFLGSATRATFVPTATFWPSSMGISCNTPVMPARTRSEEDWLRRNPYVALAWSTWDWLAISRDLADSSAILVRWVSNCSRMASLS